MLFSSPIFFIFGTFYLIAHWTVPFRARLILIIIGSTIFYAYLNPAYIWICYLLSLIGYTGGKIMGRAVHRRRTLICLIAVTLLPLLFFKYFNFFIGNISEIFHLHLSTMPQWPLPLGISFITFTVISYIIDIYRGTCPVESGILRYIACILFFPHLIAGPFVRPAQLIPQLILNRPMHYAGLLAGLGIFTLGLVKKLVFADSIAGFVDRVFAGGHLFSGFEYVLAIYGFTLQIYCDFSGYTDMAIGVALALGVKLPNNFERPYLAHSLPDFWKRWHITLSSWLRDYLYFPLGGNRKGFSSMCVNILITMALGGLWHGASWNFVLWGVLHGIGICISHGFRRLGGRLPTTLSRVTTFHFVALLWVFFRAKDLGSISRVLSGPFISTWTPENWWVLIFPIALVIIFALTHRFDSHRRIRKLVLSTPSYLLFPALVFFWIISIALNQGNSADFIYFDF